MVKRAEKENHRVGGMRENWGGGKGVRMAQEMTSDPEGSVRSESLAEGRAEWEQRIKKEMRMECQIDFKWGHMLHQWP